MLKKLKFLKGTSDPDKFINTLTEKEQLSFFNNNKVDLSWTDSFQQSLLHIFAIHSQHHKVFQEVLKHPGAATLVDSENCTPLHYLAVKPRDHLLLEVLEHPGVMKIKNSCGWTPLHELIMTGSDRIKDAVQNKLETILKTSKDLSELDVVYSCASGELKQRALDKINFLQDLKINNDDPEIVDIERVLRKAI